MDITRAGLGRARMLALVLAVGACGGSAADKTANSGEQGQHAANTNQMNPQPRNNLRQGGKLTWPLTQPITNFNVGELDGAQFDAQLVAATMLPSPFLFDAASNPRFNPDYLAGEPTLVATPKQVVTYELNPKAIWYDGTPITAADYIAEWKALNGTNKAFHIAASNGYDQIENVVQGTGPFQVVVTFKEAYADWKALFSLLYPASTDNNADVFNSGWKDHVLTSAGPFKFASFDATAKTYVVVPNEKWWGNKAKLDSIVFRYIDSDAWPTALANGEIDVMDVGPSVDYYNKVRIVPGIEIRVAGGPNFRHLTINGSSALLQDVTVRQAVAMGVDRAAIARAELGALPVTPTPLGNHIFMQNQAGYQDNSGVVAYDPAKARQMLDSAGWKVQGTVRVKDGKTLSLNIVIPTGIAVSQSECELIQNMLAQIQVGVKINTVPSPDFFEKYITPGRFDLTVFSWIGTPFPISSGQSIYRRPSGTDIRQNFARTGSKQIDSLFDAAVQELDPAKARQTANEIDKLIWAEVHSLPLYQRPDIWAMKKDLANMGASGFASILYEDIGWMAAPAAK